jgi:hypothetical protein
VAHDENFGFGAVGARFSMVGFFGTTFFFRWPGASVDAAFDFGARWIAVVTAPFP